MAYKSKMKKLAMPKGKSSAEDEDMLLAEDELDLEEEDELMLADDEEDMPESEDVMDMSEDEEESELEMYSDDELMAEMQKRGLSADAEDAEEDEDEDEEIDEPEMISGSF